MNCTIIARAIISLMENIEIVVLNRLSIKLRLQIIILHLCILHIFHNRNFCLPFFSLCYTLYVFFGFENRSFDRNGMKSL